MCVCARASFCSRFLLHVDLDVLGVLVVLVVDCGDGCVCVSASFGIIQTNKRAHISKRTNNHNSNR